MITNRLAFLRADASNALGGGHIFRCLTLADALAANGWRCTFVCKPGTRETVPALGRSRHEIIELDTPEEAIQLMQLYPGGVDLLVVDHYGLDNNFETACRPWARQIMALDDGPGRSHDCDILLNQNLGVQSASYHGLVPDHCRLLMGPSYALLRPQFLEARREALTRRAKGEPARRLLISFGATDPLNVTRRVVAAAAGLPLEIDVVFGTGCAQQQAIHDLASQLDLKVRIHTDVVDMAALMSAADLSVGAGGSTSWERCTLGLPSLMLVIADNQELIARSLDQAGAVACLDCHETVTDEQLAAQVRALATNPNRLGTMAAHAAAICDGRGTQRIMLAMLRPAKSKHGDPVTLRLASVDDEAMILAWQRAPATRRYARNPVVPLADEHHRWMGTRISDPNCLFTLVECAGVPAGMLRLDRHEGPGNAYEVSIFVAPERYRRGLGACALALARQLLPGAELIAEVLPENQASAKLFSSAGYRRYDDGLFHCPPRVATTSP